MQIIYSFNLTLDEYIDQIYFMDFTEFDSCPICHSHLKLIKHGFYFRNVITNKNINYFIPIRRFVCSKCKLTISLLPDFLLPYFQSTVIRVINLINDLIQNKIKRYLHLAHFYKTRFLHNLNAIISFFRLKDFSVPIAFEIDENLFLFIDKIISFPAIIFSKSYYFTFNTHFLSK